MYLIRTSLQVFLLLLFLIKHCLLNMIVLFKTFFFPKKCCKIETEPKGVYHGMQCSLKVPTIQL